MKEKKDLAENAEIRYYCTLFNKKYLIKGLAMYQSLYKNSKKICLFILCMDEETFNILCKLKLNSVKLIKLKDFENDELLRVKGGRTIAEYCWTCAPCLLNDVIENNADIDFVTYLDSDLLFYSSPEPIYEEVGQNSTVIVEHRFSERFKESIINGRYNVQWVSVRRDRDGLETLKWWKDRCIEWCFYRLEDDRMGDQKYLDQWTTKFKKVHELQHIGSGVGPWNYANYKITEVNEVIYIDQVELIFYHFHSFRMLENEIYVAMPEIYKEEGKLPECIYTKYNEALINAVKQIRTIDQDFSDGIEKLDDIPLSRPTTLSNQEISNSTRIFSSIFNKIKKYKK